MAVPHLGRLRLGAVHQGPSLTSDLGRDRNRPGAGRGEQLQPERTHPAPATGNREHVIV